MKRILKTTTLISLIMLFSNLRNTASAQFSAGITYQTFYDELSPYGRWIDYPEYGYVWAPDAGPDFRPYSTMGHWEWSDEYEWIWVSDYNWGWAPFHYGRWLYDPFYGWIWVPGYEWAPAWVVWRSGGDYCGWAPLRPGINIGINFSIGLYSPPIDYWIFAPRRYITSPRIYDYCYSPRQNVTIINNTTIINNYYYGGRGGRNVFVTGPGRREAESWTNQRIRSVSFSDAGRPGRTEYRNNQVTMYRPTVQRDDEHRFSPRQFDRFNQRPQNNNGWNNDNAGRRDNNLPRQNDRNEYNNRSNNLPNRNETRQMNPFDRREQPVQNENRNTDRRNFGNQNNNPQNNNDNRRMFPFDRIEPQSPQNNNSRNFENRNGGNQQGHQVQPRIFEQRNEGNQGSRNNDNGGRGNGRKRG
jgi:hypothetical protein